MVKIYRVRALPTESGDTPAPWRAALCAITHSKFVEDHNQTQLGRLMFFYQLHTLEFLIRAKWDSKFRLLDPIPKNQNQGFQLRGELCVAFVELLEALASVLPKSAPHPAELFALVFLERRLLVFEAPESTKEGTRRRLQSENKKLLTLENPFEDAVETRTVLDVAQQAANQLNRFRTDKYTPFVKARQRLVTFLIENEQVAYQPDPGKPATMATKGGRGRLKLEEVPEMQIYQSFQDLFPN